LKGICNDIGVIMKKEAAFYTHEENLIRCELCPHSCLIGESQSGMCRNRKSEDGKLFASGYAKVSAVGLDPIEKKPLFHFYPGSYILSAGGLWCNLNCQFCQNWRIAHNEAETIDISPELLCKLAIDKGSVGIAFTYNEPSIWYEYVYDTAVIARKRKLKIVLVTNGYIAQLPLKSLLPHVDALNIDVKSFRDEFYRDYCEGKLEHVKLAVEESVKHCHVEVTTLIINGLNDTLDEINDMAYWLSGLDPCIPLHISRYYPAYKMDVPQTSIETLLKLRKVATRYLKFVYLGNVYGADNNTYCPTCGSMVVNRSSDTKAICTTDGLCSKCGFKILNCQKGAIVNGD
jgi:pyruvate formate lyase activating enzyme